MPPPPPQATLVTPAAILRAEAAALHELALRLDTTLADPFAHVITLLEQNHAASRPAFLTGIGKSGLVAQKIAATLRSTGTPAHVLHPTEALHGDLGMLPPHAVLLALSSSGETDELLALLPALRRLDVQLVALTGCPQSTLARSAVAVLDTSISEEACPHNLAPTTSSTVMLALGDALALTLSQRRGFAPEHFATLHPGGRLGLQLARVQDRMHTGDSLPLVAPTTPVPELIHEMSRKKLGIAAVTTPDHQLLGIISDGDLRRMLERAGATSLTLTAADIMNPHPITIPPESLCSTALTLMEDRSVTALLITSPTHHLLGALHLHDLWKLHLA